MHWRYNQNAGPCFIEERESFYMWQPASVSCECDILHLAVTGNPAQHTFKYLQYICVTINAWTQFTSCCAGTASLSHALQPRTGQVPASVQCKRCTTGQGYRVVPVKSLKSTQADTTSLYGHSVLHQHMKRRSSSRLCRVLLFHIIRRYHLLLVSPLVLLTRLFQQAAAQMLQ